MISSVDIAAFVLIALAKQDAKANLSGWLRPWLTSSFDWFLVLPIDVITLFCLVLIFHPVGKVRIGGKDARPDYSYAGWIAMMFAAGIGIRLLFFGVQEPVYYSFAEGWAVYAAAGRSLGIFSYNLGYLALGFFTHPW
jgi:BCCT family betaine/carnitine transporter